MAISIWSSGNNYQILYFEHLVRQFSLELTPCLVASSPLVLTNNFRERSSFCAIGRADLGFSSHFTHRTMQNTHLDNIALLILVYLCLWSCFIFCLFFFLKDHRTRLALPWPAGVHCWHECANGSDHQWSNVSDAILLFLSSLRAGASSFFQMTIQLNVFRLTSKQGGCEPVW